MQQSKSKSTKTLKHSKISDKARGKSGVVRIIGGTMRGRKLRFSAAQGLRPTLDRVRETLFNWLTPEIANSRCLDLFAGSGAIGFEACSRSAKQVFMVEKNAKVAQELRENLKRLNAEQAKIINRDAFSFLNSNQEKFDLVFLDPPFGEGMLNQLMEQIAQHLSTDGLVYIEQESSDTEYQPSEKWEQVKFKKTSSFSYALYRLSSELPS